MEQVQDIVQWRTFVPVVLNRRGQLPRCVSLISLTDSSISCSVMRNAEEHFGDNRLVRFPPCILVGYTPRNSDSLLHARQHAEVCLMAANVCTSTNKCFPR
jgi:hypothetical protein